MENVSPPRQAPPGSHARLIEILMTIDNGLERMRPSEGPAVTHGVELVMSLFIGCVRHFRAIIALLEKGLAQEGRTLYRTLLVDSTTLAYFHKYSGDLEQLALRFVNQSLQQERRVMEKAKAIGLSVAEWEARILAQATDCQATAKEEGWEPLKSLPHIEAMLQELGHAHLYLLHRFASYAAVHTSASTLASRTTRERNSTTFHVQDYEPLQYLTVARSATDAVLAGHLAVAHLLGWDPGAFARLRDASRQALSKWREEAGIPPQETDLD